VTVALYLMTGKGEHVFHAALASSVEISHVVTAPAVGMNDRAHERIAGAAKDAGIPTFLHAAPPDYRGDVTIAAGWRRLLDVDNLVVLHDSLLPRYRGFAPLITALVNGEREIGVTAFLARPEPDTGPIVGQRTLSVSYPARMADVLFRLEPLYGELAHDVCAALLAGEPLRAAEQDHTRATYSVWRDEDDYRIDWTRDDRQILRLIDAVSDPFPGAITTLNGREIRVLAATVIPDVTIEDRRPGKVFRLDEGRPIVVCGSGLLRLDSLRYEDSVIPVRLQRLKQRFQ
jgi:methionyl-tRNA formyltransferase